MLPTIAIIIGAVVIIARLPGVIWPDKSREFFGRLLDVRPLISLMGLLMVGLGVLIGYAAYREALPLEFVLWIIGGLMFVFGMIYIAAPRAAKQLWDSIAARRSAGMLRVMFGTGVVIGLFLVVLGLTWMAQEGEAQGLPQRIASHENTGVAQIEMLSKQMAALEKNVMSKSDAAAQFDALMKRAAGLEETVMKNSEALVRVDEISKQLSDAVRSTAKNTELIDTVRNSLAQMEKEVKELRAAMEGAPLPRVNEP